MMKWLVSIRQGFASSDRATPEWVAFGKLFKKEMTTFLTAKGATNIEIYRSHFYLMGFFDIEGQAWYFNTGDVRWLNPQGMLVRTARHHKDFLGGVNHTVSYNGDFEYYFKHLVVKPLETMKIAEGM